MGHAVLGRIYTARGEHVSSIAELETALRLNPSLSWAHYGLGMALVFIGRAAAYGLAAAGETGALRVFEILRTELDRLLAFLGCNSVAELGLRHLRLPQAMAVRPLPRQVRLARAQSL